MSVEFREAPVDNERVSLRKHRIADYLQPKTLTMLLLGFSSGLPFFLVGNTFGYWLRDEHTSLAAIGFLSWVGIAYSLKFLWAPLMDRVDLPLFKRLGHRRGWMMFSQIVVGLALWAMGGTGTKAGLARLGAFALVVAFASATQDIVVDAWRIESADDGEEQGLLASAYQFSYRLALLCTDSVILIVAAAAGGFCSLKLGYMRALIIGGILQAVATAAFATLAFAGASIPLFALVMVGDNFGLSFAGVALVAYMSSLTNLGYTATQYALLSSTYAWLGKILKGFSGAAVESLSATHGLTHAYGIFFLPCGLTGVHSCLLFRPFSYG